MDDTRALLDQLMGKDRNIPDEMKKSIRRLKFSGNS